MNELLSAVCDSYVISKFYKMNKLDDIMISKKFTMSSKQGNIWIKIFTFIVTLLVGIFKWGGEE